jgi:sugar O-acyltransferase (sialic acid O-acetyltransferase NeuD family)
VIQVVGIGAGGHAKVILDILRLMNTYSIVGMLDPNCVGESISGVPVLGGDELLPRLRAEGVGSAFIGLGGVGDFAHRIKLIEKVQTAGFSFINVIHPMAIVANNIQLGQGVTIMAGVVINPGTNIGDNVIINTGAVVDHDCEIESYAHISPGAVLCGGVCVGLGAHIGAGATVRQYITVGDRALVGAGAVVVKDVLAQTVVVGVPAHEICGG